MAAGTLPAPGTRYGPCKGDCRHTDCAATRAEAASICRICGSAIGYERRYYKDPDAAAVGPLVHAACLEDQIERQRAWNSAASG